MKAEAKARRETIKIRALRVRILDLEYRRAHLTRVIEWLRGKP